MAESELSGSIPGPLSCSTSIDGHLRPGRVVSCTPTIPSYFAPLIFDMPNTSIKLIKRVDSKQVPSKRAFLNVIVGGNFEECCLTSAEEERVLESKNDSGMPAIEILLVVGGEQL